MQRHRDDLNRKRIRLDASHYSMKGVEVFLTIGVNRKRPVFHDGLLVADCVACLREQSDRDLIGVRAYCFMPDHLHLLARVDGETGIIEFMRNFKTRSTRIAWAHGFTGALWQRSYHDHVSRSSSDSVKYMRYVLENPVRRGLAVQWRDYHGVGSFTERLDDDSLWDR